MNTSANTIVRRKHPKNTRKALQSFVMQVLAGFACMVLVSQASGDLPTQASSRQEEPLVVLRYDRIDVDHVSGHVTIQGHVALAHAGKQVFADLVSYNPEKDLLMASGHVRVHEPHADILFGNFIQFTDHFAQGWIQDLRVLMADNARMAGLQGWKINEKQSVIDHGVYSPCELCGEKRVPFWQIKAQRILDDRETHDVSYKNMRLELWNGLPILYSPYLRHTGPGVRRRSGLLVPSFIFSSQNGMGLMVPYYHTFSPQRDLTLTPITTQRGGSLLGWEFRQRVAHGFLQLQGSMMPSAGDALGSVSHNFVTQKKIRGHIQGDLRYEINDRWLFSSQALVASDQTYLRRYPFFGHTSDAFLTSSAALEHFHRETYLGTKGYFFEPLASESSFHQTPMIIPSVEYDRLLEPHERWTRRLGLHFLNMKRLYGNQMSRFSLRHDWTGHYTQSSGIVINPLIHMRFDGYHTRLMSQKNQTLPLVSQYPFYGNILRALPTFGVRMRWPLVHHTQTHHQRLVEPYIALLTTPFLGNKETRIPSEDNAHFDLTPINLYQVHPFPGLDHAQKGTRLQYGCILNEQRASGYRWTFEAGHLTPFVRQKFALNAQDPPTSVSYASYVGGIRYQAPLITHQGYVRFQCHVRSLRPERWETGWFWNPHLYQVQLHYAFGHAQKQPIVIPRFSTTTGTFGFPLYHKEWRGNVSASFDTNRHWLPLTQTARATYTNDCFNGSVSLGRVFYQDRDVKPNTTFFVTFSFKNLGTFSTQTLDSLLAAQQNKAP